VDSKSILEFLEQIERGELSAAAAAKRLVDLSAGTAQLADAHVDLDRAQRCGFPEVVYAEGKTSEAVVAIFEALAQHGQDCLATRVSPAQAEWLLSSFPSARYNAVARTVAMPVSDGGARCGPVAVITAGTSDRAVAEEALETLRWMRCEVELIVDVGVAGPQRLVQQRHRFADALAVVVVAGMEGALPSVVGGYVSCPVIAVPTSVGYGASFGGVAALLGMLNSCASNVAVVNIDSGFKGGYVAGLIARNWSRTTEKR
jgi:NCAIR mutase (PurE)-related protein